MNPFDVAPLLKRIISLLTDASDILFSPGYPPMAQIHGELKEAPISDMERLTAFQTEMLALTLMRDKPGALQTFLETGSVDLALNLPSIGRFRANLFLQRGVVSVVMRVIPASQPSFETMSLPEELRHIADLRNGIVLVTGPTGSGKSTTMAALVNLIAVTHPYHIVTIEDPIEFLFTRGKSVVHQRELGVDTQSFAEALRSALRQAPQVIMLGEMRDRESIEIAMEAAETGHLILSTLHTNDAARSVERILGSFPRDQRDLARTRFAQSFRYIVSQRLVPRPKGRGRLAVFEILKRNERTVNYILKGEEGGGSLVQAMEDGDGMQTFDQSLLDLVSSKALDKETALRFSTNRNNLELKLGILKDRRPREQSSFEQSFDDSSGIDDLELIGLDDAP